MELLVFILCAFAITQDVSAFPTKGPYKSEHCIKMTPEKEQQISKIITRITDFLGNITSEFEDFDIRLIKLDIESHSEDEVEDKDVQLQLTVNDCTEDIGDEEDDAQKSKKSEDFSDEPEKDISIEVPEKANKETTVDERHIETSSPISVTNEQTTIRSTAEGNDINRCESCPCVCDSVNQNAKSTTSKDDNKTKPNTDKAGEDTNKNANKNNSDAFDETVKGHQTNTKTVNHYDITPVETIRFYDFGDDTNSNINNGDDKRPEITYMYTFEKDVQPEVIPLDLSGMEDDVYELIEKNHKPLVVYIQKHADQNEYIFL